MSPQVILEDVLPFELSSTAGTFTRERPDVHVI